MAQIMEFVGLPGGTDVVPGNGYESVDLGLNIGQVFVMQRRYSLSRAWRAMMRENLPRLAKGLNVDFERLHYKCNVTVKSIKCNNKAYKKFIYEVMHRCDAFRLTNLIASSGNILTRPCNAARPSRASTWTLT
jgi:hypothetical protein